MTGRAISPICPESPTEQTVTVTVKGKVVQRYTRKVTRKEREAWEAAIRPKMYPSRAESSS